MKHYDWNGLLTLVAVLLLLSCTEPIVKKLDRPKQKPIKLVQFKIYKWGDEDVQVLHFSGDSVSVYIWEVYANRCNFVNISELR